MQYTLTKKENTKTKSQKTKSQKIKSQIPKKEIRNTNNEIRRMKFQKIKSQILKGKHEIEYQHMNDQDKSTLKKSNMSFQVYCGNPARAGKRKARTMRFGVGAPINSGLQRKACMPPK